MKGNGYEEIMAEDPNMMLNPCRKCAGMIKNDSNQQIPLVKKATKIFSLTTIDIKMFYRTIKEK